MDRGGRRPHNSLYEMIRYGRLTYVWDLARVWRPPNSYGVHTLLFLGLHPYWNGFVLHQRRSSAEVTMPWNFDSSNSLQISHMPEGGFKPHFIFIPLIPFRRNLVYGLLLSNWHWNRNIFMNSHSPKPHPLLSLNRSFIPNWKHCSSTNPILILSSSPYLPPRLSSKHHPP